MLKFELEEKEKNRHHMEESFSEFKVDLSRGKLYVRLSFLNEK